MTSCVTKGKKVAKHAIGISCLLFFGLSPAVSSAQILFEKNPEIYINSLELSRPSDNSSSLSGSFRIADQASPYLGDIYYEISLVRIDKNSKEKIISVFPADNPVHLNSGKNKYFNFAIARPKNIPAGKYEVAVNLYLSSGAIISTDSVAADINPTGKYINLSNLNSAQNDGSSGDILNSLHISGSNQNNQDIRCNPKYSIRQVNEFGSVVEEGELLPADFKSGEKYSENHPLSHDFPGGRYFASVQCFDDSGFPVSNIVSAKFYIGDVGVFIEDINPNKTSYKKGESAVIKVRLNNPKSGDENFSGLLSLVIENEKGQKIGEGKSEISMLSAVGNYPVTSVMSEDAEKINVRVKLEKKDGSVLGEKKFKNYSQAHSNEIKPVEIPFALEKNFLREFIRSPLVILSLALVALLFLMANVYIYRKKGNISVIILFIALLFVAASLLAALEVQEAKAQTAHTLRMCAVTRLYDYNRGGEYSANLSGVYFYATLGGVDYSLGATDQWGCISIGGITVPGTYSIYAVPPAGSYTLADGVTRYTLRSDIVRQDIGIPGGPYEFLLNAVPGSGEIYAFDAAIGDIPSGIIPSATFIWNGVNYDLTPYGGRFSYSVLPGIYGFAYTKSGGFADSKNQAISVSSGFLVNNYHFSMSKLSGTLSGRVTVCGTTQGIANATLYYRDPGGIVTPVPNLTDASGYITAGGIKIPVGKYDVSFGPGTLDENSFYQSEYQTITISPNTNTDVSFCMRPKMFALSYSWTPPAGTRYLGTTGVINNSLTIYNQTRNVYKGVTIEFLINNAEATKLTVGPLDVPSFSNIQFSGNLPYNVPASGSYQLSSRVIYGGGVYPIENRTVTIDRVDTGSLRGTVRVSDLTQNVLNRVWKRLPGIQGATMHLGGMSFNIDGPGDADPLVGAYRFDGISVGTYNSLYVSDNCCETSQNQNITISKDVVSVANFTLNNKVGTVSIRAITGGRPISNSTVELWGNDSDGNEIRLGDVRTDVNGYIVEAMGTQIPIGTYQGIYINYGGMTSARQDIVVNANQNTNIDFVLGNFSSCGDGACNGSENCSTCSQDCGVCPATCPDGVCNGSENSSTCPQDCGLPHGCNSCSASYNYTRAIYQTATVCSDPAGVIPNSTSYSCDCACPSGGGRVNYSNCTTQCTPPSCRVSFSPSSIQTGSSTSLGWRVSFANNLSYSCTGNIGNASNLAFMGSTTTLPSASQTCNFSASGVGGTTNCSAAITVNGIPPAVASRCVSSACVVGAPAGALCSSSADCNVPPSVPNIVVCPDSVTLNIGDTQQFRAYYSADGTASCSPSGNDVTNSAVWSMTIPSGNPYASVNSAGLVTASSSNETVLPSGTNVYAQTDVSATYSNISDSSAIRIPGRIPDCTFVANPQRINLPQSSDLIWDCNSNADDCTIDNGIGQICSSTVACNDGGNITVSPSQTTTYTLTCDCVGCDRAVDIPATVNVGNGGRPDIKEIVPAVIRTLGELISNLFTK